MNVSQKGESEAGYLRFPELNTDEFGMFSTSLPCLYKLYAKMFLLLTPMWQVNLLRTDCKGVWDVIFLGDEFISYTWRTLMNAEDADGQAPFFKNLFFFFPRWCTIMHKKSFCSCQYWEERIGPGQDQFLINQHVMRSFVMKITVWIGKWLINRTPRWQVLITVLACDNGILIPCSAVRPHSHQTTIQQKWQMK